MLLTRSLMVNLRKMHRLITSRTLCELTNFLHYDSSGKGLILPELEDFSDFVSAPDQGG